MVSTARGHSGPRDGWEQEGPAPGCVEARRELDPGLEKDLLVSPVFRAMSYFSGRVLPQEGGKGSLSERRVQASWGAGPGEAGWAWGGPHRQVQGGVSQDADVVGLGGL